MGTPRLNIAVLTSSRADYGIYLPLLKLLKEDPDISLSIIVFGTHCKKDFGLTKQHIVIDGYEIYQEIDCLINDDSPKGIGLNYAETNRLFTLFWDKNIHVFDMVFVLGDRYEMAAAVNAGVPFSIPFAHIHAGETTLGAIDNIYRHQISLASQLFFVSTFEYKEKINQLKGSKEHSYYVGALGLQNISEIELLNLDDFEETWRIDLRKETILMTVHPETIAFEQNKNHVSELITALRYILEQQQVVITLPNADTFGSEYRNAFKTLKNEGFEQLHLVENFGSRSYFTCMQHANLLIGNTSSGIIEAASFQKMVINLGDRQKGRLASNNVINIPFDSNKIIENYELYKNKRFTGKNIYWKSNPAMEILNALKNYFNK